MAGLGIYQKNKDVIWLGVVIAVIAIIAGFVLHFFFGIKIISIRRDFKHKKF